jgi:two-component system CheB/CheR fusion protein
MKKPAPKKSQGRIALPIKVKVSPSAATKAKRSADKSFPIVGIGASAGGLEALVLFLEHTPKDTGMAFVVIQHLDPTQKGMMPELLQRATSMKVQQVADRTKVLPNHVYVLPPNSDMSILHGMLHLLAPVAARGLRLPIDFFFRSLAEDQREHSVGIILSGMGSDGSLGINAIKEKAGVVLVQDPETAKFNAMPQSAVATGLADIVAPVEELPDKLIAYSKHLPRIARAELPLDEKAQDALEKIVVLLLSHTGHDFTMYRRSTLHRRVDRRMGIHQIVKIGIYVRYLQENPQELDILFKELLIGVTKFFRDSTAWELMAKEVFPALIKKKSSPSTLRAWVAGCSTGEEAYSLAMVFTETLKLLKSTENISLQIYATDLDKDAIDKARQGLFTENIVADISPARLSRFFIKEDHGYRVSKQIRSMVIFAPQNLIMDPPFTKLDILSCRNLLIYLTPELQRKLLPLFHYCLNPGGVLFLGSAETIGSYTHLFSPLGLKERLFQRTEPSSIGNAHELPAVFSRTQKSGPIIPQNPPRPVASLQVIADQLLHERFAPPAVLVNEQGDIIYVSGRTGKYLEPAAGKANWNVIAMAREGLRYDLAISLQTVQRKKGVITLKNIKINADSETRFVDLTVQSLEEPKELSGMVLILFSDTIAPVVSAMRNCSPRMKNSRPRKRRCSR